MVILFVNIYPGNKFFRQDALVLWPLYAKSSKEDKHRGSLDRWSSQSNARDVDRKGEIVARSDSWRTHQGEPDLQGSPQAFTSIDTYDKIRCSFMQIKVFYGSYPRSLKETHKIYRACSKSTPRAPLVDTH